MLNRKQNIKLLILFCALCLQCSNSSYAAYDVVKAKTISNEYLEQTEQSPDDSSIPVVTDDMIPEYSPENSLTGKIGKKMSGIFKKKNKDSSDVKETPVQEITEEEVKASDSKDGVQKKAYTNEVIEDSNRFTINADKVTYNEQDGNVYAYGNVEIIANAQEVVLRSDEAVLDKDSQTLKMSKNVKIYKDGNEISGEFLIVNLNEQNVLMDNPTLKAYQFIVKAQEAFLVENDLQMLNGSLTSEKENSFTLETSGFQRFENVSLDYLKDRNLKRDIDSELKQVYDVKSKEIVITSYKDHNSVVLKRANVYYNKHKIITNTDIEIISDKQNSVTEVNAPEAGNFRNFGMYVGYGFVFKMPKGQILKVMPVLTSGNHKIGVGALVRHRTQNSILEAGYNTSTTNLVLSGRYNFGNGFSFTYGRNAYMPEGFMGARRSGYAAQLQFQKSYYNEDLDARFNHGIYAGAFSDYVKHKQESHAYATTRFRYIAEIRKDFFKYKNSEQDFGVRISALAQSSATVYGSGETTGVARIGPFLTTNLRKWESSVGYMVAGVHGDSPFVFDKYRYGKSSFMLNEKFNFNNKFALGYRATLTPNRDNYERDLLTESRLYAILGPQDLKLCLSYDFIRDIAHIDFMFLLGTSSSKIDFDKLITRNIDSSENKKDFYKSKPVKIVVPEKL